MLVPFSIPLVLTDFCTTRPVRRVRFDIDLVVNYPILNLNLNSSVVAASQFKVDAELKASCPVTPIAGDITNSSISLCAHEYTFIIEIHCSLCVANIKCAKSNAADLSGICC